MKKLIAIAVVFALVAGTAFAVDLSADVDVYANLFEGASTGGHGVEATAGFDAVRLQGAGELADGKFGGKVRLDANGGAEGKGYAWWKPIDQFKLTIGHSGASDGFWGKDGNAGWNFNQKAYAVVASGAANIWGGKTQYLETDWGTGVKGLVYRDAFAGAYDTAGLYLDIKPMDMLGINIGIPVFGYTVYDASGAPSTVHKWDKALFQNIFFQVDLNFAFGNIAITYKGDSFFMYFGGAFGAINLDVGLSAHDLIDGNLDSIYFGAALKYSGGAFGLKFRTAVGIPVKSGQNFRVLADVLPYFAINDNISVFVNVGMGMGIKSGLQALGWHFNPYMRIGAEWGPSFYVGINVEQLSKGGAINFALPIGITVGF